MEQLLLTPSMLFFPRINLLALHYPLNGLCARFEHGLAVELFHGLHVIKQQIRFLLFGAFLFHFFCL